MIRMTKHGAGCASYNTSVNYLVIDTSSSATVLGLASGGDVLDRTVDDVKTHSREILPSIERLLADADISLNQLNGIIYGQGPGSFTGLRIAVGVVQGLAYGLQIPVVPVSSMAAIAHHVASANATTSQVFVGLFARLEEVYFGAYQFESGKYPVEVVPEGVTDVADLPPLPDGQWLAVGNANALWEKIEYSTGVKFLSVSENAIPSVPALLELGQLALADGRVQEAREASPVYLRETVAEKPSRDSSRNR